MLVDLFSLNDIGDSEKRYDVTPQPPGCQDVMSSRDMVIIKIDEDITRKATAPYLWGGRLPIM